MRSMHKFLMQCVTATVAVILAIPAMPQEPAGQAPVIKSQVGLVNLFATVRDKNKRIVPTLKQEDFRVSEDNQDQKIAFFSREVALPITMALLLDNSGSAEETGSKVRLEEAIEAAQRTDTVIHILLVVDPRYGGNLGVAHKLAEETGGRMISVRSEKKLMEAFDEISEELRSQYTLGYYPTNSAQDGKFRKVKVETTEHDLKVLARKGYYAPKG